MQLGLEDYSLGHSHCSLLYITYLALALLSLVHYLLSSVFFLLESRCLSNPSFLPDSPPTRCPASNRPLRRSYRPVRNHGQTTTMKTMISPRTLLLSRPRRIPLSLQPRVKEGRKQEKVSDRDYLLVSKGGAWGVCARTPRRWSPHISSPTFPSCTPSSLSLFKRKRTTHPGHRERSTCRFPRLSYIRLVHHERPLRCLVFISSSNCSKRQREPSKVQRGRKQPIWTGTGRSQI